MAGERVFSAKETNLGTLSHEDRIRKSKGVLSTYTQDYKVLQHAARGGMIYGEVPLLSPYDHALFPSGIQLISIPEQIRSTIEQQEQSDIARWNSPDVFLERLAVKDKPFIVSNAKAPVMDRLTAEGRIVAFEDLRITSPSPEGKPRVSRKTAYQGLLSNNIMGMGRMPLMLGAVPDVASVDSYKKAAQAGVMVTATRDKIWSEPDDQIKLVKTVIEKLRQEPLSPSMEPTEAHLQAFWKLAGNNTDQFDTTEARTQYEHALKESWVANMGAAIESSPRGIERAKRLYEEAGCRMFRVYSPEGGHEIVERIQELRALPGFEKGKVQLIAGQIMDGKNAVAAEKAGADAIMIGVAGGSQCTTSVNADIPVNTTSLLNELRGQVRIPIGIEGGGVGTHAMTALALGASFLSKPGEIGVSLAGAGDYVFADKEGKLHMLYCGEASNSSKFWRSDSYDALGRIRFSEGEGGIRELTPERFSLTGNIDRLLQSLAVALVFQRKNTIDEVHSTEFVNVVQVSEAASGLSRPYAQ